MFLLAMCLFGYAFRRSLLRACRLIFTQLVRFFSLFHGFELRNHLDSLARFYRGLRRRATRDQVTFTDFIYYDGSDLIVPVAGDLDVGNEFLLALGERIILKQRELSQNLAQIDSLLTTNFVQAAVREQDVLANEFDLAAAVVRPLPAIPEAGAVGVSDDAVSSAESEVLCVMANRFAGGAWSV